MRWLDSIIDSMDMNLSKLQEIVGFPDSSGGKESAHRAGEFFTAEPPGKPQLLR